MATLTTLFGGVYLASGGSSKTPATPPINASSSDEADFIKYGASDSPSSFVLPTPASAPTTTSSSLSPSRIIIRVPPIANTLIGSSSRPPRPPRRLLPLLRPPPSTKVFQNDSYVMIETDTRRCGLDLSCVYIATG